MTLGAGATGRDMAAEATLGTDQEASRTRVGYQWLRISPLQSNK